MAEEVAPASAPREAKVFMVAVAVAEAVHQVPQAAFLHLAEMVVQLDLLVLQDLNQAVAVAQEAPSLELAVLVAS